MTNFIIFFIIHFFINKICLKTNYLIDKKDISDHKKKIITETKTPLSGGLVFFIFVIFVIPYENYILLVSIIFLYFVGIMSDINYLSSPPKRFVLQSLVVLALILGTDLTIISLSIEFLDNLLEFKIINIFFILVCFLVLINGFNFLDGINTIVTGNFMICLMAIYYTADQYSLSINFDLIKNVLTILLIIFIFNFFGKSFLGDSGTYMIGLLVGFIVINFAYNNYLTTSPYFAVCLLWYPALENLFSILRRIFFKNKLSKADNNHLHHLIYLKIRKQKFLKKNLWINTFTGLIINCYVFFSTYVATFYYNHTRTLLLIILLNMFVYLFSYYYLCKGKKFN